MSEASIPAWKRAGLKHSKNSVSQSKAAYDPLKEGLKRAAEAGKKPAKPAKKPKLAKADKPLPTHELDQLAYLRQYAEDRSAWKFSKQKQNWLLKHMFSDLIEEKYEDPLVQYIEGLQGSARNWALEDSMDVINRWNDFMRADIQDASIDSTNDTEKSNDNTHNPNDTKNPADTENPTGKSTDTDNKNKSSKSSEESNEVTKSKKSKTKAEPAPKVPSQKMVLRAQKMVKILGAECPQIEILDKPAEAEQSSAS